MDNNEKKKIPEQEQEQEFTEEYEFIQSDRLRLYDTELDDFNGIADSRKPRNVRNTKELSKAYKSIPWLVIALSVLGFIVIMFAFFTEQRNNRADSGSAAVPPTDSAVQAELNSLSWVEQYFLPLNRFSRPGTRLETVNGIVIHNIGNPNTTALQNRNYFANVVPVEEIFASSHFIICLDGDVIQCIPVDEIAYASNARNVDTLSIEVCHPDETGKFTDESYNTAVRLTAWLCIQYNLTSEDVIRHFDVERETGPKECPRYFVENEAAWEQFKADVQREIDRG
jgi:hypothetical protein